MVQWVKALALKAYHPEFNPWNPLKCGKQKTNPWVSKLLHSDTCNWVLWKKDEQDWWAGGCILSKPWEQGLMIDEESPDLLQPLETRVCELLREVDFFAPGLVHGSGCFPFKRKGLWRQTSQGTVWLDRWQLGRWSRLSFLFNLLRKCVDYKCLLMCKTIAVDYLSTCKWLVRYKHVLSASKVFKHFTGEREREINSYQL